MKSEEHVRAVLALHSFSSPETILGPFRGGGKHRRIGTHVYVKPAHG